MPTLSTRPSIQLFNRFRNDWQNIDQEEFTVGLQNKKIATDLENHIEEIQSFSESVLSSQIQPRNDYRELFCYL